MRRDQDIYSKNKCTSFTLAKKVCVWRMYSWFFQEGIYQVIQEKEGLRCWDKTAWDCFSFFSFSSFLLISHPFQDKSRFKEIEMQESSSSWMSDKKTGKRNESGDDSVRDTDTDRAFVRIKKTMGMKRLKKTKINVFKATGPRDQSQDERK